MFGYYLDRKLENVMVLVIGGFDCFIIALVGKMLSSL